MKSRGAREIDRDRQADRWRDGQRQKRRETDIYREQEKKECDGRRERESAAMIGREQNKNKHGEKQKLQRKELS